MGDAAVGDPPLPRSSWVCSVSARLTRRSAGVEGDPASGATAGMIGALTLTCGEEGICSGGLAGPWSARRGSVRLSATIALICRCSSASRDAWRLRSACNSACAFPSRLRSECTSSTTTRRALHMAWTALRAFATSASQAASSCAIRAYAMSRCASALVWRRVDSSTSDSSRAVLAGGVAGGVAGGERGVARRIRPRKKTREREARARERARARARAPHAHHTSTPPDELPPRPRPCTLRRAAPRTATERGCSLRRKCFWRCVL